MKSAGVKPLTIAMVAILTGSLIINLSLIVMLTEGDGPQAITGFAAGTGAAVVGLCYNYMPILNVSAGYNATAREPMVIYLTAEDIDIGSLNYSINDTSRFNITSVNSTSAMINYTWLISEKGNYSYLVEVTDSSGCTNSNSSWEMRIQVTGNNTAPMLVLDIENYTWYQGGGITNAFTLDSHFVDPENDLLAYSAISSTDKINITIDEFNRVSFRSISTFFGAAYAYFIANDSELWNMSNGINLTVIYVPPIVREVITAAASPGGGGGGGGGSAYKCEENWTCGDWGPCGTDNRSIRNCIDINQCFTNYTKPIEEKPCVYKPTCYDNLMNQGELGIDCGGPCPPCGTCFDKEKNQGELGIDCGGPCEPCPGCFDGKKNQGEEGIDCGGPCPPCPVRKSPIQIIEKAPPAFSLTMIIIIIALLFIPLSGLSYMQFKNMVEKKAENAMRNMWGEVDKINKGIMASSVIKALTHHYLTADEKNIDEVGHEAFRSLKRFISGHFSIDYEFSDEELAKELRERNVDEHLSRLLRYLHSAFHARTFSGKEGGTPEIRMIMLEAIAAVSVVSGKGPGKRFVERLRMEAQKPDMKIFSDVARALSLILSEDFSAGRAEYKKSVRRYSSQSQRQKQRMIGHITWLYELLSYVLKNEKLVRINHEDEP